MSEISDVIHDLPALLTAPFTGGGIATGGPQPPRSPSLYPATRVDNLARPSATTIVPDLQGLEVGQWVPMSPSATPTDRTAFKVDSFEVNEWLLWTKPDSTWAWQLTPSDPNSTRVVTRVHAVYDWHHPLTALLGVVLMEFGDFAMQRRMLRGIKARAESLARSVRP